MNYAVLYIMILLTICNLILFLTLRYNYVIYDKKEKSTQQEINKICTSLCKAEEEIKSLSLRVRASEVKKPEKILPTIRPKEKKVS